MKSILLVITTLLFELSSVCAAPAPADRAKKLVETQLAALGNEPALVATFTKDAVVLVRDGRLASASTTGLADAITRNSPHGALQGAKLGKLLAGGDDTAVWLSAEVVMTVSDAEPGSPPRTSKKTVRFTELMTAEAGWKVVAAAFAEPTAPFPAKVAPEALPGSSAAPGTLAPLLAAPAKLAAALSKDASVSVFGTAKQERAFGPAAARSLLKKWGKLAISVQGPVREVRGTTWGFAQANLDLDTKEKYPVRMAGLIIGRPDANGVWQVVAVHYTAL